MGPVPEQAEDEALPTRTTYRWGGGRRGLVPGRRRRGLGGAETRVSGPNLPSSTPSTFPPVREGSVGSPTPPSQEEGRGPTLSGVPRTVFVVCFTWSPSSTRSDLPFFRWSGHSQISRPRRDRVVLEPPWEKVVEVLGPSRPRNGSLPPRAQAGLGWEGRGWVGLCLPPSSFVPPRPPGKTGLDLPSRVHPRPQGFRPET